MKNNIEVKQVGKFVLRYLSDEVVAISWKGYGCLSSQLMTNDKVKGTLTHTDTYCDLPFEGSVYPGICFHIPQHMSHDDLEKFLEATK